MNSLPVQWESKPRSDDEPSFVPSVVLVRSGQMLVPLRTADIVWIEAAGNYCRIHATSVTYVTRATLSDTLAGLDPDSFVRIHRSTVINIHHVVELHPWYSAQMQVVMTDGTRLTLSRSFRKHFASRVKHLT